MKNKYKFILLLTLVALLVFIVGKTSDATEIIFLGYGMFFGAALGVFGIDEQKCDKDE